MRPFVLLGAGLALSGCTVGPVYQTPQETLPDRYSLLVPVPDAADRVWWRAFQDPVLDQLVERALSESLSLAQAQQRIYEAEAAARRDGMRFDVSTNLSVTSVFDGPDTAGISAGLGLDVFGGRQRRAEAALARLEAAQAGAEDATRLLMSELVLAYVQLRFSQQSILLRQKDLRSRRRTLRDISTLVDSGAATRLDRLRAQALVAETEARLPQLTADVARQRNRITTLLARPAGTLGVDLAHSGRQPAPAGLTAPGVPADLLRRRPDIRQAERLYAAAISEIGAAEAARFPSLSLNGDITSPLGGGAEVRSLSAGIVLPLLQQRELAGQADVARARANQAYLQWRLSVLTAVEEVENALAAIGASGQAVRAARKVVRFNEEALVLSRQLLDTSGQITVLDLLDRERAVSAAREELARALRDYAADYIALNISLGLGIAPQVPGD